MKRALVALAAALLGTTLAPVTASAEEAPARVLIVGDSVTQGYKGDYTWRYFLWRALQDGGESVDFVGRRTGTFHFHPTGELDWDYDEPDAYADPDFDQDHGAWYGGRLEPSGNYFYDPIGPQVTAHKPDVIVSMWGINDLSRDDRGPADLIAFYRDWFAMARAVDPDVDFVVARLPYTWLYDGEVVEFNELLGDLAIKLTTQASRISVATMSDDYTQAGDSGDYVHPNTSGQRKIAGMIGDALVPLLEQPVAPTPTPTPAPVPTPTATEPVVVPPAPAPVVVAVPTILAPPPTQAAPAAPRRVKATRQGSRTVVTWRRAIGSTGYLVRCGAKRTAAVGTRATLRSRSEHCSVRSTSATGVSRRVTVRVAGSAA